ncbi:MAG TPA: ATP-binding cassette domain-containing protein [Mycobacteriales bacterium]|nr:ATP-binding cassette domain-containing protein [Mycobacteriales bacterium]
MSVRLEDVWVDYRPRRGRHRDARRWALRGVNLALSPGCRVGVIGGNGAGKTTLLRTVTGVYRPTRGVARISGRAAGICDLGLGVQRDLSGLECLAVWAAVDGMSAARWRRQRAEIVDATCLTTDVLEQSVYTYSLGMTLRLQLALALVNRPAVLAVDEVLSAADAGYRDQALDQLTALAVEGTAVVFASHDLGLIAANTDEVTVLRDGAVDFVGPPGDALARYPPP